MDLVLWVGRINANERLMVRVRNRTGTFGGVMYRSWPVVSLGPSFFVSGTVVSWVSLLMLHGLDSCISC